MPGDAPSCDAVYAQLHADHSGAVLMYLSNKLRDPDLAEDVAQEAWLNAHRGLSAALARGDFRGKSWLMQIATNAMFDHFRRAKARPKTSDLDDLLAAGSAVPDALADRRTPERDVLSRMDAGALRGLVGVLLLAVPRAERELLWWYEYGHRTYADLARRYECTVPSVKSRLYRARQHLDALVASEVAAQGTRSGRFLGRLAHLTDRSGGADACWPWLGTTRGGSEGRLPVVRVGGRAGRVVPARRAAYALLHGAIPPWVYAVSPCAPPGGAFCLNPGHLVGSRKGGEGIGKSGGRYVPLDPSLLVADAYADQGLGDRRRALGLTTVEFAALAGVPPAHVYTSESALARWHRGPEVIRRITVTLDRLERERQQAVPA